MYYINNVSCDTYVYIDDRRSGDPVLLRKGPDAPDSITVCLFANGVPFSVSPDAHVQLCGIIQDYITNSEKFTIDCSVGGNGEIVIPAEELSNIDMQALCEINISEQDNDTDIYRFKTANFTLVVIHHDTAMFMDADGKNFLDSAGNQLVVWQ